ncbi:MAG: AAA family ATPase [Candidatus Pacebacteria bacterium]|nr:AAA family ATPase [Candidatus Paceibacterota bacterium]
MYLKKLETTGFKSFANKTVLDFPRGVTAIVGPNGSGKSNVADAVKWVLGEQSMKSLRGKKGEDVIFTGSDKKAKMSAAVVSLFLDNSDKKIPIDYDEVVIARKLFRNGDSEYLINKSRVRLSDIIDLLAKSGVSQRGYCVINQGMADSILSATPAERMIIFEEATGVRRFQIKKQQTINKLEATKRNLQRVTDLLNEIEPRLTSLRRQASRAQKRGEVEEGLKREQEKLFSNIWLNLNQNNKKYYSQRGELEKNIKEYSKDISEIKNNLSGSENNNDTYSAEFSSLQKEADSSQEIINDFQKNLSITEGRIQIEKEKEEKLKSIEYLPINLGYVKEKLSSIISTYNKFLSMIENLSSLENIKSIREEGTKVKNNVGNLLKEVEEGKVSQSDEEVEFDDSNLKKLKTDEAVTLDKVHEYNKEYGKIKERIYELNRKEQDRRQVFFKLEKELQIKQDEMNRFKDNLNQINIELAKFEVRKEDLINEIKDEFKNDGFVDNLQNGKIKQAQDSEYFDQEECRSKIRKLKFQLEQIGGIDPLIVEEYEETQSRFEFLSTQSEDLFKASNSLREVIKELDEKIEKIFKSSFKKINEEFNKYFKTIFGGGKAGLSIKYSGLKEEKEDNVESEENGEKPIEAQEQNQRIAGIEISAVPPGKKISSLDMLSGGERALASIAILFAIVSNNPPPFSVLDEIDAALDEANSARLSDIIKDISTKTQFIMITHNREMMQQAGVLYGVTMHDDGVSKIISLKLDEVGDGK